MKCIFWQILNEIVKIQILYRNKMTFETKNYYILIQKILYFVNKSVKRIIFKVTYNKYVDKYIWQVSQKRIRGAAAPKNGPSFAKNIHQTPAQSILPVIN